MKKKKQHLLVNGVVRTVKEGVNVEDAIATLEAKGCTVKKCKPEPTVATLIKWDQKGVAYATDGCRCDPDGECEHGHKSWLLQLGMI